MLKNELFRVQVAVTSILGTNGKIWGNRATLVLLDTLVFGVVLALVSGFGFGQGVVRNSGAALLAVILGANFLAGQYRKGDAPKGLDSALKYAAGGVLAGVLAFAFAKKLGFTPEFLKGFFAIFFPVHGLVRLKSADPVKREWLTRWALMGASVTYLFQAYLGRGSMGAGDGYWYSIMVADFVTQWRAGVFPAFVGQTEYAFNGAVFPHRFAPFLQHAAGILDLLTWRQLSMLTLLNLALFLSAAGGMLSAYFCVRRIHPCRPWINSALALLYVASPGVLALAYTGGLFMSVTTLPFVPLVLLGIWRIGKLREPLPIVACLAPLAAVWLCHPPIALWLHVFFASALALRWLLIWRQPRAVGREIVGSMLLFTALGGFTFVSALTVGADGTSGDREASLKSIVEAFPAVLKPVSPSADRVSDYQLGWGLWFVLAGVGFFWARKRELSAGLLLGTAVGLLVLLLPVPWITTFVWGGLPQIVINATFHWPMQRLAPLSAGVIVLAAAAVLLCVQTRRSALFIGGFLWVAVGWGHLEATKFLARGEIMLVPRAAAEKELFVNNVLLTRYAFLRFPAFPAYFSHGFVDPVLEHRVLSNDESTVLVSNRAAVLAGNPTTSLLRNEFDGVQGVILRPKPKISPGVRHYLRMEWLVSPVHGSLVGSSKTATRVYALPDTGLGMDYATRSRAFGLLPSNTDGFPIWTRSDANEELDLRFMLWAAPDTKLPVNFLRMHDYTYRTDELPIKIRSLAPYRATVTSPEPGLLETTRMFVAGYRAEVDGKPAVIARSKDGLVAIQVPAGRSEVTLSYPGRPALQITYWLSCATWLALGCWAVGRAAMASRKAK